MSLLSKLNIAAKNTADFIEEGNYQYVIVSGHTQIISKFLFNLGWSLKTRDNTKPTILEFGDKGNKILYSGFDVIDTLEERTEIFKEFINQEFPELNEHKEGIIYLDDFSCYGHKANLVKKNFSAFHYEVSVATFCAYTSVMGAHNFFIGLIDNKLTQKVYRSGKILKKVFNKSHDTDLKKYFPAGIVTR